MELTYVNGKVVMVLDNKEACGLLEDMNEITYKLEEDPTHEACVERSFKQVRKELRKLLDELNIL